MYVLKKLRAAAQACSALMRGSRLERASGADWPGRADPCPWGWHALDRRWAELIVTEARIAPGTLVVDVGAGTGRRQPTVRVTSPLLRRLLRPATRLAGADLVLQDQAARRWASPAAPGFGAAGGVVPTPPSRGHSGWRNVARPALASLT